MLVALERHEARHGREVELTRPAQHLVERRARVGRHGAELDLVGVEAIHKRDRLVRHGRGLLGEPDHAERTGLDPHVTARAEDLGRLVEVAELVPTVLALDLLVPGLDAERDVPAAGAGHDLEQRTIEGLDRGLALPLQVGPAASEDPLAYGMDAVLARREDRIAEHDVTQPVALVQVLELLQHVLRAAEAEPEALGQGVAAEGAVQRAAPRGLHGRDGSLDPGEPIALVGQQVTRRNGQGVEVPDLVALGLVHDAAVRRDPREPRRAREGLAGVDPARELRDGLLGLPAHHRIDPAAVEHGVRAEGDLAPEHRDAGTGGLPDPSGQGEVLIQRGARGVETDEPGLEPHDRLQRPVRTHTGRIAVVDRHLVPRGLEGAGHVGQLDGRVQEVGTHRHAEAPHEPARDAVLRRAGRVDEDDSHGHSHSSVGASGGASPSPVGPAAARSRSDAP